MITEATLARFAREVAKYPAEQKQSAVMACLSIVQQEQGFVSVESEAVIAEYYSIGAQRGSSSESPGILTSEARVENSPNADSDDALKTLIRSIERDSVLNGSSPFGDGRIEMLAARILDEAGRAVLFVGSERSDVHLLCAAGLGPQRYQRVDSGDAAGVEIALERLAALA